MRHHRHPEPRQHQIGDSFSEGEQLTFTGIPFFAPELFRSVRIKNQLKIKQLQKGLQQLDEQRALQVDKPMSGADLIIDTIGIPQSEDGNIPNGQRIRRKNWLLQASISSARCASCDDKKKLAEIQKANASNLAKEACGEGRQTG